VTVQEDSKVVIWDQKEMKQLQTLGHPEETLVCCSISLDDAYVIVGSAEGSIYSWDSNTGREYRHYEDGHKVIAASTLIPCSGCTSKVSCMHVPLDHDSIGQLSAMRMRHSCHASQDS
jgi:WD40 repeat protein